ncbi:MAG TPA: hypothetical protein VK774_08250 [Solirubrobacteraceae bacterium]|nr:hypothetical protein [Solirubrobacteraceae bacterium]
MAGDTATKMCRPRVRADQLDRSFAGGSDYVGTLLEHRHSRLHAAKPLDLREEPFVEPVPVARSDLEAHLADDAPSEALDRGVETGVRDLRSEQQGDTDRYAEHGEQFLHDPGA